MKSWSVRHRDEQTRYCYLYVLPVIGHLPCRELTRDDFQLIIDKAPTASVAKHIRSCLTGLVGAGLDEGHLLIRQDLLRGVRWHCTDLDGDDGEPVDRAVTQAEIPSVEMVHALARRTAERTGVWWRELQLLLVATRGCVGVSTTRSSERSSTSNGGASPLTARSSTRGRVCCPVFRRVAADGSRCSRR